MRIYLDTCCLSRLFDPPTQDRVRQEAEAIGQILTFCFKGNWYWISSAILSDEIEQTPDLIKRSRIKDLLPQADQIISLGTDVRTRGKNLESLRLQEIDAFHIACAEIGNVDIFLTTDDKLLRRAERFHTQLNLRIENPYTWLKKVNPHERIRNDRS